MAIFIAVFIAFFGFPGDALAHEPVCYKSSDEVLAVNNAEVLQWKKTATPNIAIRAHVQGTVTKIFGQKQRGYSLSRNHAGHASFRLKIGPNPSDIVRVIYNLDFGALPPLKPGMQVEACGEYENSDTPVPYKTADGTKLLPSYVEGGFIHGLHRALPSYHESHDEGEYKPWRSGFIKISGATYGDCDLSNCPRTSLSELAYPAGKSFAEIAQSLVIPYFDEILENPLHLHDITFSLRGLLSAQENTWLHTLLAQPEQYDGAAADFKQGQVTLVNGTIFPLYRTTLQGAFIAYDMRVGLVFDIPGLPNKIYLLPMSATNLREYTTYADGKLHDISYDGLCDTLRNVHNPYVYAALADVALGGRLQALRGLTPEEQALVLDMTGISMAEYYQETKIFDFYRPNSLLRVGPVYNMLLYSPHILQVTNDVDSPALGVPDCAYFNSDYHERMPLADVNGRIITQVIAATHPYDYAVLAAHGPADNFFTLLTYLAGHPGDYDDEVALSVRRILLDLPNERALINQALRAYVMEHSSVAFRRDLWLNFYDF